MKKFRLCIILCIIGAAPMITYAGGQGLSLSAQMGSNFATIDVEISLNMKNHPAIYYLALARDSIKQQPPTAEMILAYADGNLTAGLKDGRAVRGHWIASSQYTNRMLSLAGGENIRNIPGEQGFIDGFRYDIYMVAVDRNGRKSNVAVAENIMAMPFAGTSGSAFTIENGKQLANIQRMADLYRESKEIHGSTEFLNDNFILADDIDLRGYENWKPITIFRGSLDGQNKKIKNLKIRSKGESGACGFFGTLEDAFIQNLIIEGAKIFTEGPGPVGGLAGSLSGETILIDCHVSGDIYGESGVGGFVGTVLGAELPENANHSIKIVRCTSTGTVEATRGLVGGFAGSMAYASADACGASVNVKASGLDIGGFVGRLTHRSRVTNSWAYGDVESTKGWHVGGFVGLLIYGSGIEYSLSSGNVWGMRDVGGFAGAIAAPGAPNTLFGCLSFANWVSADDANAARFVGRLDHEGVNNCFAYLGTVVAGPEGLSHVLPNPYGADGGDFNDQTIEAVLERVGWDQRYWAFDFEDGTNILRPMNNLDRHTNNKAS